MDRTPTMQNLNRPESYEGNVLDVYMKNGKIFKINRLGDTQITLQNVWVESVTDGKCTFLYGNLEKAYPARTEEDIPDGAVTVATSLDADRQTEAGYETAGYVANLVFDYAGICKIERPQKVLRGKAISTEIRIFRWKISADSHLAIIIKCTMCMRMPWTRKVCLCCLATRMWTCICRMEKLALGD